MKTMRWIVLGVAVLAWSGLGCDSGSSDEPTDTVADDTAQGPQDTAGQDDIIADDTATPDDLTSDDTTGCQNECQASAVQCVGTTAITTCTADADGCLSWGVQVACPANQVCQNGACVDAGGCEDECDTLGATECDGTTAVLECVTGLDGCKTLKSTACGTNQTCENGECTGGTTTDPGVEGCLEINACMADCGSNQTCLQGCFTSGSSDGQAAYQAIAQCAQSECAAAQSDQAAYSLCLLKQCKTSYEGCFGANWGTSGCLATLQCASACSNQTCQQDCFNAASYDGLVTLMEMQACLSSKCSTECSGTDQNACQTCATTNCATEVTTCQGA